MPISEDPKFPQIAPVGLDGLLVRFGDRLDEPANRAALAFREAVDQAGWDGVEETTISLVSTFLRFDPLHVTPDSLCARLTALLGTRDWYASALPEGRKAVTIPTCYDPALAPQIAEAASQAGMTPQEAVESLSRARLRVTTIGFAPGQPYLGSLPPAWDIPRQTGLTPRVPAGALVVAIRQLVLFSVTAPTGWRHVGQTAATLFDADRDAPFLLRPGDVVTFPAVTRAEFEALQQTQAGGVTQEPLA